MQMQNSTHTHTLLVVAVRRNLATDATDYTLTALECVSLSLPVTFSLSCAEKSISGSQEHHNP